jgi:hypothetical protein
LSFLRRLGRLAEPLLDPDAPARRDREAALEKRLDALSVSLSRLAEQVQRAVDRSEKSDRRQIEHLEAAIGALQWNTRRQAAFAERLLRASQHDNEHEFAREHALKRMVQLARREGPVLVGPWTGEVGFELLYWAPFVRWAVAKFGIDPKRITILSRGGTESWYGIAGARYQDVFELVTQEEFRAHTEEAKKQRRLRLFDRNLIRRVARTLGERTGVLHPAMMYALYMPYWKQQTSRRWVEQFASYQRIVPPAIPGLQLPTDYVAVRFYFSECFPDTEENRSLVASLVRSLTTETHVVLLGADLRIDDHRDFMMGQADRVHAVAHLMRPQNNLALQTAVIAGARALIGTYGGFSYLAPLCGVNAIAVYSQRTYFVYHLDFAQQVFDEIGGGSLTVVDAASGALMRHLGAALTSPAPARP